MLRVRFEPSNLRQQLFSVPGSLPWRHTGEEKKQIENPWTLERKDGQFISKKTALFPLFFLPAHATCSTSLCTLVQSSRFSKPGNIFFFWLSSHLLFKVQAGCLSSGGLSQTGTGWLISILLSIPCLPSKQPYEHVLNQHPTQHETEFMCTLNKKTLKIIFFLKLLRISQTHPYDMHTYFHPGSSDGTLTWKQQPKNVLQLDRVGTAWPWTLSLAFFISDGYSWL